MSTLLDLGVKAFATKRFTRLIVEDHIFDSLRERWFNRYPPESTYLGYIVTCQNCTSVWIAVFVGAGLFPRRLCCMMALSEVTILLARLDFD